MYKELQIEMKPQEQENWCYSATIQSLVGYYKKIKLSQHEIATSFDSCTDMQDPFDFLAASGMIAKVVQSNKPPAWNVVVKEIDTGNPIVCLVGMHYVLLIGYSGLNNRDPKRTLIFLDPKNPSKLSIGVSELTTRGFPVLDTRENFRGYLLLKK